MDHASFWDTLSRQLQNQGPEYIARCTFRNQPLNLGDNVILPASFSRLPTQEVQVITPSVKVCDEDLKKVRERFCRELSVNRQTDASEIQIHSMLMYVSIEHFIIC